VQLSLTHQGAPDIVVALVAILHDEIAVAVDPKLQPAEARAESGEPDAHAAIKGQNRDLKVLDLDVGLRNAACTPHGPLNVTATQ